MLHYLWFPCSAWETSWFDQLSEKLNKRDISTEETMQNAGGKPDTDPLVQEAIVRSYNLTVSMLVGSSDRSGLSRRQQ